MEQLVAAQVQHDQEVKATQRGVQELQAGTSQAFAQVQQHQQVTLDSMEQMRQEMEAANRRAMELSAQLQALKEETSSSRKQWEPMAEALQQRSAQTEQTLQLQLQHLQGQLNSMQLVAKQRETKAAKLQRE